MMDGEPPAPKLGDRVVVQLGRKFQQYLDVSTIYTKSRWLFFLTSLLMYMLRVYMLDGWYIVTYGLGIYMLNLFIGFLTPQDEPDAGPGLPSKGSDEFRPFVRRVPEFKFWYALTKSVLIAFGMTFFRFFDIPVFWPILLLYFCVLFTLTMKRQIKHMRKHNYVPWSCGKAKHKDTKKRVAHDGAPQVLQVVAPAPPPAGLKKISRPS